MKTEKEIRAALEFCRACLPILDKAGTTAAKLTIYAFLFVLEEESPLTDMFERMRARIKNLDKLRSYESN